MSVAEAASAEVSAVVLGLLARGVGIFISLKEGFTGPLLALAARDGAMSILDCTYPAFLGRRKCSLEEGLAHAVGVALATREARVAGVAGGVTLGAGKICCCCRCCWAVIADDERDDDGTGLLSGIATCLAATRGELDDGALWLNMSRARTWLVGVLPGEEERNEATRFDVRLVGGDSRRLLDGIGVVFLAVSGWGWLVAPDPASRE